jgi:hypothetical protein
MLIEKSVSVSIDCVLCVGVSVGVVVGESSNIYGDGVMMMFVVIVVCW